MKNLNWINKISTVVIVLFYLNIHGQDYLETATIIGNGITTDNSKSWTDIASVTIDVTNVSFVFVTASINMRPDGSHISGREANYNIYRSDLSTDESAVIKRQIIRNSETGVESWGVGTLVHVFDTSALTGDKTYTLEHSNQGNSSLGRNVYSSARLTAVALTTELTSVELSNDVKRLSSGVNTTSATYAAVTGLSTSSITLPIAGDIYVAASINSRANGGGSVAEYKLQYSTDAGVNWFDLGKPVKRSMINTFDDGIVSLVSLLQNLGIGSDYQFRVAHKRDSGSNTITTNNANIVAIALSHINGYFPSFYSEVGTVGIDITGVSTAETEVISATFTAAADIGAVGTDLYVHSQYLVSASNLNEGTPQRMRSHNQLFLDDGIVVQAADTYYRYIPDNSNFGSGGFIGLAENLTGGGSYSVSMRHGVEYVSNPDVTEDETLTTSEVILTGFQTYDQPNPLLGIDDFELSMLGISIYSSASSVYLKSESPIEATIKIYNILGQLIKTKQINNESTVSIKLNNYKGIAIVSLSIDGKIFTKKVIL